MAADLELIDSTPNQKWDGWRTLPRLLCAIEKLNQAAGEGRLQIISLGTARLRSPGDLPAIIDYRVTGRSRYYQSTDTVASASFDVSHYIGRYTTRVGDDNGQDKVSIEIKPRWGARLLHYLLQYTTGIYLPPESIGGASVQAYSAEWLLVLLWRSLFHHALRRYHIPKEYRVRRTNDRVFKGQLDIARQIRENLADQSRFCCVHKPLTVDTIINRTIRCIFRLLSRNPDYAMLLKDVGVFDKQLGARGVKHCDVHVNEIDRIRYTRMSDGYRPLMQASKALLRQIGAAASDEIGAEHSFFIDVAELWENYLFAILSRHLPAPWSVSNPNVTGGAWLLVGNKREIRPDLIIEYDRKPVAIIDAKFKHYRAIGRYGSGGVSREDLYQMTTYLYHYTEPESPLAGIFISPTNGGGVTRFERFTKHDAHVVGVLNFGLDDLDDEEFDIQVLRQREEKFVANCIDELSKALSLGSGGHAF